MGGGLFPGSIPTGGVGTSGTGRLRVDTAAACVELIAGTFFYYCWWESACQRCLGIVSSNGERLVSLVLAAAADGHLWLWEGIWQPAPSALSVISSLMGDLGVEGNRLLST